MSQIPWPPREWHSLQSLERLYQQYFVSFGFCFYWNIISFQWCIRFCCTTSWISHIYIYIHIYPFSLELPSHLHPSSHPSRTQSWAPCITQRHPTSSFAHGNVYASVLLSWFVPPTPFPAMSASLSSMSLPLFLPTSRFPSTVQCYNPEWHWHTEGLLNLCPLLSG